MYMAYEYIQGIVLLSLFGVVAPVPIVALF